MLITKTYRSPSRPASRRPVRNVTVPAMGIIQAASAERGRVRVLAPWPVGAAPAELVPGLLRLDAECRERPVERRGPRR